MSPVKMKTSCWTWPIAPRSTFRSISWISIPSIRICPFWISKYLPIRFKIVDFPAPVAPTKAAFSPGWITKLTSLKYNFPLRRQTRHGGIQFHQEYWPESDRPEIRSLVLHQEHWKSFLRKQWKTAGFQAVRKALGLARKGADVGDKHEQSSERKTSI